MKIIVNKTEKMEGKIVIPPSKSHTIRAIAFALLGKGTSIIKNPLNSADALAALDIAKRLGAIIIKKENFWEITGVNKNPKPINNTLDVGNSGTTLRLMTSIACLQNTLVTFDGDDSIRSRPIEPLLNALKLLGAKVTNDTVPFSISGPITGGSVEVSGKTSQFLSSLLITCPLLEKDTEISVPSLNEKPYVHMTLDWLADQHVSVVEKNMKTFSIKGGNSYSNFEKTIPGDWSSAAFPLCAAIITNSTLTLENLDIADSQGDKKIIEILKKMGADISISDTITISPSKLVGIEIDLNENPDMLPALAVIALTAKGTTKIYNVPQARIKECDRISAMCTELQKMGADIKEIEDGLIISESILKPSTVDGHKDHRIIMSLICAGLGADGTTCIENTKNLNTSFPNFVEAFNKLNANIDTKSI